MNENMMPSPEELKKIQDRDDIIKNDEKIKKSFWENFSGKFAAKVATAFVIFHAGMTILLTIFQIWEGQSPLEESIMDWPSTLFFYSTLVLVIFAGNYGEKNAFTNPKKSGLIMSTFGMVSLFGGGLGHFISGTILIVTGIYTVLYKKTDSSVKNITL